MLVVVCKHFLILFLQFHAKNTNTKKSKYSEIVKTTYVEFFFAEVEGMLILINKLGII